jgi:RNA polymerase sigma-70 factor (ECF subfamily)
MTDAELVQRAIDGDERAFADLVGSFRRPILSHLNRILHDSDGSEDLWQEVQFRVWRNLKRFDQSKKFSTWIFTIGTNLALNELRPQAP